MSKTTLLYRDIAPGAALDATVTAPTAQDRSALAQLPSGTVEEPAATGELNQWGMDGAFVLASEISPAFWSEAMSGADGSFAAGYEPQITQKGAVLVKLGGKDDKNAVVLAAHMDTLGGMVCQIMDNGHLKLTNIGGMNPNNAEAENCKVYTKSGKVYDATFQLENASVHVNGEYSDTKRTYETMEAILDEPVKNKEDVKKLGIMTGDFVCFDPRTVVTESGYIKSRFLDDKFSTAILLGYAKYLKEKEIQTERTIYVLITSYEEVGHGGCAAIPDGVTEMISVDMGCVGKGLECDETMVSICAKDSMGPYDYQVVSGLIKAAQENDIAFAVDVYPHYGSDVDAALKAGYDMKHGLIGPGVYASHGYERSHRDGAKNTLKLLKAYLG